MCEPRTLHMAVWSRPTHRQRSAPAVVADKGARFRNFHWGMHGAQSPYPAVTAAALAATAAVLFLHVRRRRAVVQQVELVQLNLRDLPKDAVPAELRVETYVDLDKAARYRPASHTSPLAHAKFGSRTRAVVAMSTSTTCAPRLTSLRCLMASMPTQWTTCSERSASATPEPRC